MATGFPTGLYYQFGERLKADLSKENVELQVKVTGGTLDNLALLRIPAKTSSTKSPATGL
jgi:TRAP-type uncharacterized transport system substrate-binding protein